MISGLLRKKSILVQKEEEIRDRELDLLNRLATALERFGPDVAASDLERFKEARDQLSGLFLLVIAGEFNSGKSSFINALLGEKILPEGVTPTTDRINVLKHGPEVSEEVVEPYLLQRTHPALLLEQLNIVDTPGTNAVIRRHEELTRQFIPRCDLVLFVTSADRPFTESERGFLEHIGEWGKKVVFIINKIDILTSQKEIDEVVEYVRSNATQVLGEPVEVFPVSARMAQSAGGQADKETRIWKASGLEAVENFLLKTLTQEQRIRLKLLNPVNVGLRLSSVYKEEAFQRLKSLASDVAAIENIDRQLTSYHEEVLNDFQPRLIHAITLINEMEARGNAFFEEHVRLSQIRHLLNRDKLRSEFERRVIGETPRQLEEEVTRIVDWLADRNLRLWHDIQNYIDRRKISRHRDDVIGEIGGSFNYNRQALYESIGRTSRDVISVYNKEHEAKNLSEEVRNSFATTALAEVGAVGLGALLVTLAHTAFADFTGIVAATAIAVGGLYILPARRRKVKQEFAKKLEDLRTSLTRTLTRQVNKELSESQQKINETIAPYRRFVTMQQEQLSEAQSELVTIENSLLRLKTEIS